MRTSVCACVCERSADSDTSELITTLGEFTTSSSRDPGVQVSSLPLTLPGARGNGFLPGSFNCCFGFALIHETEYSHLSPSHTDTHLQH